MDCHDNQTRATAQRLMEALKRFNRVAWHERSYMGFKPSEIRVLFCVARGDMKVSEISKRMHVTSPTVTQVINGLEANGLVERSVDPTDRRAVRVQLTPKGESVRQKAGEALYASFNGLIEYLGEERSNELAELLTDAYAYFAEREASLHQSQWSGDEIL
jgi:DNA-binding MarR family transcriptional regulator